MLVNLSDSNVLYLILESSALLFFILSFLQVLIPDLIVTCRKFRSFLDLQLIGRALTSHLHFLQLHLLTFLKHCTCKTGYIMRMVNVGFCHLIWWYFRHFIVRCIRFIIIWWWWRKTTNFFVRWHIDLPEWVKISYDFFKVEHSQIQFFTLPLNINNIWLWNSQLAWRYICIIVCLFSLFSLKRNFSFVLMRHYFRSFDFRFSFCLDIFLVILLSHVYLRF